MVIRMGKGLFKSSLGIRMVSSAAAVVTLLSMSQYGVYAVSNESEAAYVEFYVSPDGTDSGSGTLNDPFATISEARNAIRLMDKTEKGGVTVYIREGVYTQESTLEFTAEDSGNEDFSITYKAYNGEAAVIEGGIVLDSNGFSRPSADDYMANRILDETAREKVVVYNLKNEGIDLSEMKITSDNPGLSLYYDGNRAVVSRYPNYGDNGAYVMSFNDGDNKSDGSSFYDKEERVKNWDSVSGAQVAGFFGLDWIQNLPVDIKSYNSETNRVTLSSPTGLSDISGISGRYYYTNIIEEMDAVGEYYVDAESGLLYFYAPDNYSEMIITVGGCRDTVIKADVDNYTFDGLIIEGGYNDNVIISGDDNTFNNCVVRCCGNDAVESTGNRFLFQNSEVYHTGGTGIILNGGSLVTVIPSDSVITNNKFHDFGDIYRTYNGAVTMYGSGFTVSHNEIYHAPHTSLQNIACDFIVEYNYFHDLCYEAGDAGAVYDGAWYSQGNCYRNNVFENIINEDSIYYTPHAYYSDGGGGFKNVYSNLFINVDGYGVYCGGRDIKAQDNVFVNTSIHWDQCTYYPGAGVNSGYILTSEFPVDETVAGTGLNWKMRVLEHGASGYGTERWSILYPYLRLVKTTNVVDLNDNFVPYAFGDSRIRNNVFASTKGTQLSNNVERLANIRDNLDCTVEDICFADFENGNYSIGFDSKIYHVIPGFRACDFAKVGVQNEN